MNYSNMRGLPGYGIEVLYNGETAKAQNLRLLNREQRGAFSMHLWKNSRSNLPFRISPLYRVSKNMNIIEMPTQKNYVSLNVNILLNTATNHGYVEDNEARFITFNQHGEVCEYKACIFSQEGSHFLSMTRSWVKKAVQNSQGDLVIDGLNWPQQNQFCSDLGVPPVRICSKLESDDGIVLEPGLGEVMSFDCASGTGSIRIFNDEVAKVSYWDIARTFKKRPRVLLPGQIVTLDVVESPENRRVTIDSSYLAKNVQLVNA